eukprot:scaffold58092_cov32-Tisochrysis_lutea.AAC.1
MGCASSRQEATSEAQLAQPALEAKTQSDELTTSQRSSTVVSPKPVPAQEPSSGQGGESALMEECTRQAGDGGGAEGELAPPAAPDFDNNSEEHATPEPDAIALHDVLVRLEKHAGLLPGLPPTGAVGMPLSAEQIAELEVLVSRVEAASNVYASPHASIAGAPDQVPGTPERKASVVPSPPLSPPAPLPNTSVAT